ncbi:hypothetical protein ACFLTH_13655 [Bacteroidota bacterium]
MAKKQTATKKIKKKKWFPVVAPSILGGKIIGESLLTESSLMKGRHMNVNLMNITGEPKRQNTNVQLLIKDVRDGQGVTEIIKIERISSFMKRMVRRGRNKVDDSFLAKSGDGKRIRVKTIAITNSYTAKSVGTKLRKATREALKEIVGKNTFEKSIDDILKGGLLKDVKVKISKIAPVRTFDIRVFKFEPKRGVYDDEVPKKELVVEEPEVVEEKKAEVKEETKEEKAEVKEEKKVEEKPAEKKEAPKKETKKTPAKKAAPKKENKKTPAKKPAAKKK